MPEQMKIALSTCFDYSIPVNDMIPLLALHDIRTVSIGMDTSHCPIYSKNGFHGFQQLLAAHNVNVHSIHIPGMPGLGLLSPDFNDRMTSIEIVKTGLEHARMLGASCIILHATTFEYGASRFSQLYPVLKKSVDQLVEQAAEQNIKIAVENLYETGRVKILKQLLEDYPPEYVGFCFDTSHANLTGEPFELLRDYGTRLLTTHISDNRGRKDDHLLPFEGNFEWETFAGYMRQLEPVQPLLFEPETTNSAFKNPRQFLLELSSRAQKLISMIRQDNKKV